MSYLTPIDGAHARFYLDPLEADRDDDARRVGDREERDRDDCRPREASGDRDRLDRMEDERERLERFEDLGKRDDLRADHSWDHDDRRPDRL